MLGPFWATSRPSWAHLGAILGYHGPSWRHLGHIFRHLMGHLEAFCRHSEVEAMWSKGLALGGSYDNAVVVDGKDVLSPGGLRHSDEPVRHKMLDALGDIALAGYPILGHYIGHRAGHGITHGLLKSLFSDSENFEIISCDQDIVDTLPGSGVQLSEVCKVA